jgi:hypothetical protein
MQLVDWKLICIDCLRICNTKKLVYCNCFLQCSVQCRGVEVATFIQFNINLNFLDGLFLHTNSTMDARTAAMAADADRIRKGHALKLRVAQHK